MTFRNFANFEKRRKIYHFMRFLSRLFIIIILSFALSSMGIHRIDYRQAMNKNVCKDFKNDVLAYFIFIDSKTTSPWTEFDIRSTLDSINVAVTWLNQQANKNNISLKVRANYFVGKPYSTIKRDLPQGSVKNTLKESGLKKGYKDLNLWADFIAKKVGSTFEVLGKDGIPEIKNPKNKERLIAYLRDNNNLESVALIFMVNNYYRDDISTVVNTFVTDDVEFAIVSYKYPSEIAHNILTLYGAAPMYKSALRKNDNKIKQLLQDFPNDLMQDPYGKNIKNLSIGKYTKFLIGWSETLDTRYETLLTDGIVNF
jgi:hypothetical protein